MASPIVLWRNASQRLLLEGGQCSACKKLFYPTVQVCACGSRSLDSYRFKGMGTVVSWTQVTTSFGVFAGTVPFCLALVRLDEGVTIVTQLTDVAYDDIVMGMPVCAVLRRYGADGDRGMIQYGIKFRPIA